MKNFKHVKVIIRLSECGKRVFKRDDAQNFGNFFKEENKVHQLNCWKHDNFYSSTTNCIVRVFVCVYTLMYVC